MLSSSSLSIAILLLFAEVIINVVNSAIIYPTFLSPLTARDYYKRRTFISSTLIYSSNSKQYLLRLKLYTSRFTN